MRIKLWGFIPVPRFVLILSSGILSSRVWSIGVVDSLEGYAADLDKINQIKGLVMQSLHARTP